MNLSHRSVNLGLFAVTAAMMLIAYFYFQKYLGLLPCPLCVSQRIFAVLAGVIALIAVLHNPESYGKRVYGALTALAGPGARVFLAAKFGCNPYPKTRYPPAAQRWATSMSTSRSKTFSTPCLLAKAVVPKSCGHLWG